MEATCRLSALILPLLALAAAPSAVMAAEASPWDRDISSAVRLLDGGGWSEQGVRVLRAGLHIKLDNGWKTYWRYPGDSGVPPAFDFSASDNVKSVTVLYPAPKRFADGAGGHSIGYSDEVILPLRVEPKDAGQPVTLRLKLDYAACEKVCVPAKATTELVLTGAGRVHEAAIARAEALVPRAAAIGTAGALSIRAVRREAAGPRPRVIVDVAAPAGRETALFAEGPTAQWALPLPEPVTGAGPGLQRFAFDIDGVPPGADVRGADLRLTAIAGEQAIEVVYRLD
jgi:DsbC/DsbD-like thiol-disulfide interchange protein